jgi:PKD repeat protein
MQNFPAAKVLLAILALSAHSLLAGFTVDSAAAALPATPAINEPVSFAVAATDADGILLTYTWDFGDGSTGSGPSPVHAFIAAGTYTVAVTISNGTDESTQSLPVSIAGTPAAEVASSFQAQLHLLEKEDVIEALSKAGISLNASDLASANIFMSQALSAAQKLGVDAATPATAALFGSKAATAQKAFAKFVTTVEMAQQKVAAASTQAPAKKIKLLQSVLRKSAGLDKLITKSALFYQGVATTNGGFHVSGNVVKIHVTLSASAKNVQLVMLTSGAPGTNIATAVLPDAIVTGNYLVTMGPDKGAVSFALYVDGKRWGGIILNNLGPAALAKRGADGFDGRYIFIATVKQSFQSFPVGFTFTGMATVTNGLMHITSNSLPPINTVINQDGTVSFTGFNLTNDRVNFKGTFTPSNGNLIAGVHNGTFDGIGHGNYTGVTSDPGSFIGIWTALKQ